MIRHRKNDVIVKCYRRKGHGSPVSRRELNKSLEIVITISRVIFYKLVKKLKLTDGVQDRLRDNVKTTGCWLSIHS